MDVDAATQTMINNIPAKTGRSLEEWFAVLDEENEPSHGKALAVLKSRYGVSHGFANLIVTQHRQRGLEQVPDELVNAQYAGGKASLRPLYERLVGAARELGGDVEVVPKKTGVSLRRAKQFALIEAPSSTRISVGLNLRGTEPSARLRAASGMCTHRVDVKVAEDVDPELLGWLRAAYDQA